MIKIHPFGYSTHVGNVRTQNEDCFGIDESNQLWVVADGLGGHEAGDVASRLSVETILEATRDGTELSKSIHLAHAAIGNAAQTGHGHPDMGTTVVTLKLDGDDYEIAWVGDSRAYLWNGSQLIQITRDHTVVQELVDGGFLPIDRLKTHPYSNILNRTLGVGNNRELLVDRINGTLTGDEQFLLCSDGLTNEVDDHEIHAVLSGEGHEQDKVDQLVQKALYNGGSDNITVVLVNTTE